MSLTGKGSRSLLGTLCALVGIASLGYGIANHLRGNGLDAFDGLLMGIVAFVAGITIIRRRDSGKVDEARTGRTHSESTDSRPDD